MELCAMRHPVLDFAVTVGVFTLSAGMVYWLAGGPATGSGGAGMIGSAGAVVTSITDSLRIAEALNEAMANVVERALPGVVSVHIDRQRVVEEVRPTALGPMSERRIVREPGVGSGVIVSKEGLVITNWHVVAGDDVLIRVTLHGDEEPRRATLVDKDESVDIALLKVEPRQAGELFPWMVFGDSDLMRPGHFVFALGNPLNLAETVTQGIISNRSRRVSDTLDSYLQTDCAINPGNSGGPLVNLKGELIGINTRLVIGPQESPSGQGYGLAIPGNEVQDAYERMIHKGRPRGYVGVTVDDWPVASYQTGRRPESAVVVGVDKGSPAAAAGLRKDDLIRALDGEPVRSSAEFFRRLRKKQVGETLALEIRRGAESMKLQTDVVDLKSIFEKEEVPESLVIAGMTVRGLRREERMRLALPDSGGVFIMEVAEDSPLHGKIVPGEVLLRVTDQVMEPDQRVQSIAVFAQRMTVLRDGGYVDVLRAKGSVDRVTFSAK